MSLLFVVLYLWCSALQASSLPRVRASTACNYSIQACGNLQIPYPFGMSPGCGLPLYSISCKLNSSYGDGELAFLQVGTPSTPELQVLSFSTNTLLVNSTHLKANNCTLDDAYGYATFELSENGPFTLADDNKFVVIGCNSEGSCNATMPSPEDTHTISCSVTCYNEFDMAFCNGYACCSNGLPPGSRRLSFQGRGIAYSDYPGLCGFSTVLSPSSYYVPPNDRGSFSAGQYGLNISWVLQSSPNCSTAQQGPDYACSNKAECMDGVNMEGYTCICHSGYRGDGYKAGTGCEDIDECEEQRDRCEKAPLGICTNTEGSYRCSCASGVGSGLPGSCIIPNHSKSVLTRVLLGGFGGAYLLAIFFAFACISRRAYRRKQKRQENFKRIRGDQLMSFLFSERELIRATDGFSDDHVLGEGGFGKVYWGKLSKEHGGKRVAIKRAKPKAVEEQVAQMQSFVKEILLLSKTTHRNVVQLLGCCVETLVPLLVYEFVENGTLCDYLRTPNRGINSSFFQGRTVVSGCSLWAWRLRVAIQTADALSYLHNMSEPIFHLDMKSANILIDKDFNPKVADFGLSCFLTSDASHLTNPLPAGTFGYVDPEYYTSSHITDKCDVYSFGVILLELISAMPASQGAGAVLAHRFRTEVNMGDEITKHINHLPSFIDIRLGTDEDVLECIHSVAKLAYKCVAIKGSDRPSMQEVFRALTQIESRYAGNLGLKGSVHIASPDHMGLAGLQELYHGAASNKGEDVPLYDYKCIPSEQYSTTSSSVFNPPQSLSKGYQMTSAYNDSRSSAYNSSFQRSHQCEFVAESHHSSTVYMQPWHVISCNGHAQPSFHTVTCSPVGKLALKNLTGPL